MINFSHLTNNPVLQQFPAVVRTMPTALAGCYLAYAVASAGGELSIAAAAAPAPVVSDSQPALDEAAVDFQQIGQWHLFGQAQTTAANDAVETETQLRLKLLGTFAASPATVASAVIQAEDGSQKKYKIGNELPGGAVLADILATRVLFSHNGRREVLALQRQNIVSAPSAE